MKSQFSTYFFLALLSTHASLVASEDLHFPGRMSYEQMQLLAQGEFICLDGFKFRAIEPASIKLPNTLMQIGRMALAAVGAAEEASASAQGDAEKNGDTFVQMYSYVPALQSMWTQEFDFAVVHDPSIVLEIDELVDVNSLVELNSVEETLWNDIIAPAMLGLSCQQRAEHLTSVLGGGYVKIKDDGVLYQAIKKLEGVYIRESSHDSCAPEFSAKLPNLGAVLAGVIQDEEGFWSWFQLEGSPQVKVLKKDASNFHARFVSEEELPLGYTNDGRRGCADVNLFDWAKHDLWDFPQYWASGKTMNIGPYGKSANTEKSNPIVLRPKH